MDIRRNPEPGRQAVLWLATAFVVLIGAAACAFIILAAVERPSWEFIVWGVIFGGLFLVVIWMGLPGDKKSGTHWLQFWLASRRRRDARHVLRIGRKRGTKSEYGTNSPPTLESVREAAEQNVSWVPHGPPPDRSRPRD